MTVTFFFHNDKDESIIHRYDCECVNDPFCEKCHGSGEIEFRESKFELNVSNSNFAALISSLGYSEFEYEGEIDPNEMLIALDNFADPKKGVREHLEYIEGNIHFIKCELTKEDFEDYYTKLRKICNEAIKHHENIGWD